MTFNKKLFLFLLPIILLLRICAVAQDDSDFPQKPEPPRLVNDLANVLSADETRALEQKLRAYNDSTSTQITIVTVQSIGMYDVAQYAIELGNRWQVGQKGKDNGVMILAAIKDRKVNISPGYGLEGALPDALCGRIIRNEIAPAFKSGNYYQGFDNATDAIILAARGEYKADAKPDKGKGGSAGIAIGIILLVYFIIWLSSRGGGGGGNYMSRGGRRSLGGPIWIGGGGFGRGGGGGFGGGSSGGFGGFGGGSFGGGGASGSW